MPGESNIPELWRMEHLVYEAGACNFHGSSCEKRAAFMVIMKSKKNRMTKSIKTHWNLIRSPAKGQF